MKPKELIQLAESLGLGPKELAHLVGISARTIRRGVKAGGTTDLLLKGLIEKLNDPNTHLSIRALSIIAARGEGLKALIARLLRAYVMLDLREK